MSNQTVPADGTFDPYHKWLGIPPDEQPPNHYRLLAITLFESDPDVIQAAAVARTTYVRQCATGPHANASQQILNQVSEAEICLLAPKQKAAYDAQLKAGLESRADKPSTGKSAKATSSAQKKGDAKSAQFLQKLDKQKKQIETLLEKCEFATAISALEKLAAVKNPQAAKYAKWAAQQLPKAKRGTQDMRESSAAVYRTAAGLFDRNDYEEAAEMLQQIPTKYRDAEFNNLLQECLDLQEEIVVLQEDIEHAESLKRYDDLQPTVERLLEIKPGDRRARQLLKELKTYGKGGGMRLGGRGGTRFDAAGNTSSPVKLAIFVVIPLVLFGIVGWMTMSYVRDNNKTIQIKIDDPTLTVQIDGQAIALTGTGDTITLKTGMHALIVKRDDTVLQTRQFEVVKGKNPVLEISSESQAVAAGRGASTPTGDAKGLQKPTFSATLHGHQELVTSIAFSPDGRWVVSGSDDKVIKLWDAASGNELRTFAKQIGVVRSVAFSPDGTQIVSGNDDKTVRVWDASTGEELQVLNGHASLVRSASFSPDGQQIVSSSNDKTIKVWDAETGREIQSLAGHTDVVRAVVFSPDGRSIASASFDKTIKLWDSATGEELRTLTGHTGGVGSVAFSDDGKLIASGSYDKSVKLWNALTGEEVSTLSGHTGRVGSVAFSPDGALIVSGGDDKTIRIWDVTSGQAAFTLDGHADAVNSVEFSPTGKQLGSGGSDMTIKLWDVARPTARPTAKPAETITAATMTLTGHTNSVYGVAFSPNGRRIVSGSRGGNAIMLWDATTGKQTQLLRGHTGHVSSVAFSPNGQQIVSGSLDNTIKLWDASTGTEVRTFSGHTLGVLSVAFSPDGTQLVSGSYDKSIKLWETATGQQLRTLDGHQHNVLSVVFSSDGKQIVSGGRDNVVRLWDASTGRQIREFQGHTNNVMSVAISPDGKRIVSGCTTNEDDKLKVWDATTGQEIQTLGQHTGHVRQVAFSPNGKWFASASNDKTIKVWDAATGAEVLTLSEHEFEVISVAFSPDSNWIVSGSNNGTIKLWDVTRATETPAVKTLNLVRTMQGHTRSVGEIDISPDGRLAVSGSHGTNGNLRVWNIQTGELLHAFNVGYNANCVEISPNGQYVAAGGTDRRLRIWSLSTYEKHRDLREHTGHVAGLAFSPDSQFLLATSTDGKARYWDVENSKVVHSFLIDTGSKSNAGTRISSDGRFGIVCPWQQPTAVHVLDLQEGKPQRQFKVDGGRISNGNIALSSDDRTLLVMQRGSVAVCDLATGTTRQHFPVEKLINLAFLPDNRRAVCTLEDGISIWDTETGTQTFNSSTQSFPASGLAVTPDGKTILTGHIWLDTMPPINEQTREDDFAIRVWQIPGNTP